MISVDTVPPVLYAATHDPGCFAARIALGLLGITYEQAPVDTFPGTDLQSRVALALSPTGSLPILRTDTVTVCGRTDVLRFLAAELDPEGRLASADEPNADVARWLAFADTGLVAVEAARTSAMVHAGASGQQLAAARAAVLIVEDALSLRQLRGLDWLAAATPTVADIAVYPVVALMRDIGLEYGQFPAVRRWMRLMRDLAPHEAMPGILDVR